MIPLKAKTTALVILLSVSACALLGKNEPLMPRYFSPEGGELPAPGRAAPGASAPRADAALELRLGRISTASYLGERIVFRDSEYELGFYEERRWTERPENYLRRALARSLFEERGVHRIVSGAGPTLDVELTELAEVKRATPIARARATYVLFDGRSVRAEATVTVELPIPPAKDSEAAPEAAVRAMTGALADAVARIVERVVADLRATPQSRANSPQLEPPAAPSTTRASP